MSKKLKLSPWHDGSVKPKHVGVYQRRYDCGISYCYWNGKFFGWANATVIEADMDRKYKSASQRLKWRGVLK